METTTDGLQGTWKRPGSADSIIESDVEGPAAYWDNLVDGKAHLLLDFFGGDGYHPYESTDVMSGTFTASDRTNFPTELRHGSVLPIDQVAYDALGSATWT